MKTMCGPVFGTGLGFRTGSHRDVCSRGDQAGWDDDDWPEDTPDSAQG